MKTIPAPILKAGVDMYRPFVGECLTETRLVEAFIAMAAGDRQAPAPAQETLLTVSEFQKALQVSRPTLWRLRKSGAVRVVVLPGIRAVRIPASEITRLAMGGR